MVPGVGLEPTRIAPADFKSAASANSATPAKGWRRRADSNRRIGVLQTPALTTWPRRLDTGFYPKVIRVNAKTA